ncbi:MAG TPA: outer membrane beta-barrel protein [Terriglobia bacterium]
MRKIFWLLLLVCFLPLAAVASDPASNDSFPRGELFGGYSFFYSNAGQHGSGFNGGSGSIAENVNPWFGGVFDFSTQWHSGANVTTFMYGPVFSYRKDPKITPFVRFLGGGVRGSVNYLDFSKAQTSWGFDAGGGVDARVTKSLSIRVVQVDYVFSHFSGVHQDNIRVSVGLL